MKTIVADARRLDFSRRLWLAGRAHYTAASAAGDRHLLLSSLTISVLQADMRYVSTCRLQLNGEAAGAAFRPVHLKPREQLTPTLPWGPGAAVSAEPTPRTRTNVFLDRIFRMRPGLCLSPGTLRR